MTNPNNQLDAMAHDHFAGGYEKPPVIITNPPKGWNPPGEAPPKAMDKAMSAKQIIHSRLCQLYDSATSLGAQSILTALQDAGYIHREPLHTEAPRD